MSYSWTCEGSGFSAFKQALELMGVPLEFIELERSEQAILFTAANGRRMVAEEYLSVDDGDCDGTSRYDFVVYREGQRPELEREVILCGGGPCLGEGDYPEPYEDLPRHFIFHINDGQVCALDEDEEDYDDTDDFWEEDDEQDPEDLDF